MIRIQITHCLPYFLLINLIPNDFLKIPSPLRIVWNIRHHTNRVMKSALLHSWDLLDKFTIFLIKNQVEIFSAGISSHPFTAENKNSSREATISLASTTFNPSFNLFLFLLQVLLKDYRPLHGCLNSICGLEKFYQNLLHFVRY